MSVPSDDLLPSFFCVLFSFQTVYTALQALQVLNYNGNALKWRFLHEIEVITSINTTLVGSGLVWPMQSFRVRFVERKEGKKSYRCGFHSVLELNKTLNYDYCLHIEYTFVSEEKKSRNVDERARAI
jgi:hypothetical protein